MTLSQLATASSIRSALARQGGLPHDAAGGRLSVGQQMRDALPLPDQLVLALQYLLPQPVINGKVITHVVPALALQRTHIRINISPKAQGVLLGLGIANAAAY